MTDDDLHVPDGQMDPAEVAQELKRVAGVLWQFFQELKSEGFSDEQALRLVLNWHAANG